MLLYSSQLTKFEAEGYETLLTLLITSIRNDSAMLTYKAYFHIRVTKKY